MRPPPAAGARAQTHTRTRALTPPGPRVVPSSLQGWFGPTLGPRGHLTLAPPWSLTAAGAHTPPSLRRLGPLVQRPLSCSPRAPTQVRAAADSAEGDWQLLCCPFLLWEVGVAAGRLGQLQAHLEV